MRRDPHSALWVAAMAAAGCSTIPLYREQAPEPPQTVAEVRSCRDIVCTPNVSQPVEILALVTAVDDFDENGDGRGTGTIFFRDPAGGSFTGLQAFNPTLAPLFATIQAGDLVRVRGEFIEFLLVRGGVPVDSTERTTPEIQNGSVSKIGETGPPAPIVIAAPAELSTDPQARGWIGSLVTIANVNATAAPDPTYGEIPLDVPNLEISRELYEIPGVTAGTHFSSLTGVLNYFFGYKLLPRGPEDVVP